MEWTDYSPPAAPSRSQQEAALRRGLGRAMQWARAGRLDEGLLLEACLHDQRYDQQVEGPRGAWLWRMVEALGAADRFRAPLLHALQVLDDEANGTQLCQLAYRYGERGDGPFRDRLYEIVEQRPFPASPWLGEADLIALEGEAGLLFAVRARGQRLADAEWDWDDGYLIREAAERFGQKRVRDLLTASTDEAVRRFREHWRQQDQGNPNRREPPSHQARMAAISVDEVLRAAEAEERCHWLRGWGRHASEADLHTVFQRLAAPAEPRALVNLLRVFSARALPAFDARLIALARHADAEVRRFALIALALNTHPLVRELALTELACGLRDDAVALFTNNFQPGDEPRILDALELPADEGELQGLLMDVLEVLEQNTAADCSRLGVVCYALIPCEHCRFRAARLLRNQGVAPAWLTDECRDDSNADCRELGEGSAPQG